MVSALIPDSLTASCPHPVKWAPFHIGSLLDSNNSSSLQKHEELSEYLGMGNMTELITDLQYIKEEDEEINMSKRQTPPAEVTYVFNSLKYKNVWKILIFSL